VRQRPSERLPNPWPRMIRGRRLNKPCFAMAPNPHHDPFPDPVPPYPRTRPLHGREAVDLRGSLDHLGARGTPPTHPGPLRTQDPDAQRLDNRNSILSSVLPTLLPSPCTRSPPPYWPVDKTACRLEGLIYCPASFQLPHPNPFVTAAPALTLTSTI
jgi:hypothetical protein